MCSIAGPLPLEVDYLLVDHCVLLVDQCVLLLDHCHLK